MTLARTASLTAAKSLREREARAEAEAANRAKDRFRGPGHEYALPYPGAGGRRIAGTKNQL